MIYQVFWMKNDFLSENLNSGVTGVYLLHRSQNTNLQPIRS
jgi:hypothetical protein